jgi:hypothetical protein
MREPSNETQFRRLLIRDLDMDGVHACPIESHAHTPGIPDMNVCQWGCEVWYELKFARFDRKKPVDVRSVQVRWADARTQAGGRVWFILGQQHESGSVRYLLVPGSEAHSIAGLSTVDRWERFAVYVFNNREELVKWMIL